MTYASAHTSHTSDDSLLQSGAITSLERAVECLHELWLLVSRTSPAEQPQSLTSALNEVLGPILRVYLQTEDPVLLTDQALMALQSLAQQLSQSQDALWYGDGKRLTERCLQLVTEADTRLRQVPSPTLLPPRLTASETLPALQRRPLSPILLPATHVEAPALESAASENPASENPASEDPAQGVPATPEGFNPDPLPMLTPAQWAEFHARDCFGDIVALLPQRVSQLGESWAIATTIEQRLVTNLDAIAALGDDAYRAIETACRTAIVVDEALCAGLALVAGCVAGRDLIALTERLLLTWETDEAMWSSVAASWKLSPNRWLPTICLNYLRSTDLRKQALAVDVLGYLGHLTAEDVTRLLTRGHLEPRLVLPYLHVLPLHERHDWLRNLYPRSAHAVGRPEWWWASALADYAALTGILEEEVGRDPSSEAWLVLALYGERQHAEAMLSAFTEAPTPELARALGWAGQAKAIPLLITALASEDPVLKNTIAMALERITGAGLFEEIAIQAEQVMDPDVPDPPLDDEPPTLASELNDPRDVASEGSPDTVLLPAITQETWHLYWKENESRFSPDVRYRCGRPVSPGVFIDELEHALRTPGDRRLIHLELMIRTGKRVHFDPLQWVEEQRLAIEQWRSTTKGSVVRSGTWFRSPVSP